jgi:hypothetical protein
MGCLAGASVGVGVVDVMKLRRWMVQVIISRLMWNSPIRETSAVQTDVDELIHE